MKKVTYFDVEWSNSKNRSICQMGIMCEDYDTNEPLFPEKNIYINPEDNFDLQCINTHGICYERVKNEPTFFQIWNDIKQSFINSIVIGHNVASADLNALAKTLIRYNIDIPEMYYVDTFEIAKKYLTKFDIDNFGLSALCKYFNVSIDTEHDAFDDACGCKDLFIAMRNRFNFKIEDFIHRYSYDENFNFVEYMSTPLLRKAVNEFYGIIQGINIDNQISIDEINEINNWKQANKKYLCCEEVKSIFEFINEILADNIISTEEMQSLHNIMVKYFNSISSSPITLATQTLQGVLKGIIADNEISELEIKNLCLWLNEHSYLEGHFPFDKIYEKLGDILKDRIITNDEKKELLLIIKDILEPVKEQSMLINNISGLHICITGNFEYGSRTNVEKYLMENGAFVDSNVTKKTNILIVGKFGSEYYSNGNYGGKIKKAIEYNQNGCSINIVKEEDFFNTQK